MTDLLAQARSNRTGGGKENWTLEEILVLLQRKANKVSNKAIAIELGRTAYGVGYQFRRAKKFDSVTAIYIAYNVEFTSNDEVEFRINAYVESLAAS
jgi:hypothetical protein